MCGVDHSLLWQPFTYPFKTPAKAEIEAIKNADHTYIRSDESQRSPCPFLNALSNHNYLPRDGKNITRPHLAAALIASTNCTLLLADVLSSIVRNLSPHTDKNNSDKETATFSLVDLRQHNAIEHDRSFTRLDHSQGDNYTFQPTLFAAFLADARGGPITATSLARSRKRRDAEGKREVGKQRMGLRLWITTWSQTAILLQVFGSGDGEVGVEDVRALFEEERLPGWWMAEPGRPTSRGLVGDVGRVFWKHLFIKVPEKTVEDPVRGW